MQGDEPAPAPQDGQSDFSSMVWDIASAIARLDPGPAASLRHGPLAGAGAAAFWQLLATRDVRVNDEQDWAALIQAIAVLTPKGTQPDKRSAYDGGTTMGAVLHAAKVSDLRLARLLNAPRHTRGVAAVRLCRRLARSEDCRRFDIRTLARFILHGDDRTDRRIASEYYRAKATANRAAAQSAE